MKKYIEEKIGIVADNFIKLKEMAPVIDEIASMCINALKNGNKIMFCGNGGSAADSQHLAAELVGRYKLNRKAYNSIALTTDTSILTAVANDFGYDTIFERQVEGLSLKGDVLFGLSTSGNSKNVILAFEKAKEMGVKTVAFTGSKLSKMKEIADITLNVPSDITNNIQEMHITAGHLICEIIEKELSLKKALFLDRDGTINKDTGYTYKIEEFEFIDGIIPLCKKAKEKGYEIIVITNQSGVERGYYSIEDMNNFNNHMKKEFELKGINLTDIYCCPYLEHKDRKPNPGMFLKAIEKYNIDPISSISIGDKERDLLASIKAGVKKNYFLSEKDSCNKEIKTIKNFEEVVL